MYKPPALDRINQAINELVNAGADTRLRVQHIHKLCDVLLENIALPPGHDDAQSLGGSFVFKTQVALMAYIRRRVLSTLGKHSSWVKAMLNKELITSIRQMGNDALMREKYILLLWMLKFPLVGYVIKRKKLECPEDLYQGSYALLLRCIEKCNPDQPELFDAYYAKALMWNLPRLAWNIKNKKELLVLDQILGDVKSGRGRSGRRAEIQEEAPAADGSEEKAEVIDILMFEWWQKVKAGVERISGKSGFSLETVRESFKVLEKARHGKINLYDLAAVHSMLGIQKPALPEHEGRHSRYSDAAEFIRCLTMLYISYRMFKDGKRQSAIAKELRLSRERIRQYVQRWIRPHIAGRIKSVGLSSARYQIYEDDQFAKKEQLKIKSLLKGYFSNDLIGSPPALVLKMNQVNNIKLFKLDVRSTRKITAPGQVVKIEAERDGDEFRLMLSDGTTHKKIGWCLVYWDDGNCRLLSKKRKTTVSLIPYKIPPEAVLVQEYKEFVRAVRRGVAVEAPLEKLKVKTGIKYPAIATAIFGKSSALYLNLSDTSYWMSFVGIKIASQERSVVVKFEAIEKEGHIEFKEILLTGKDQWHYRALIMKKDQRGAEAFYPLAHKAHRPVDFVYLPDKEKNPAYGGGDQSYI